MENNAIKVQMGQAIRRLREKERLSQERLALMVGISRQHLSNVESGKANVSVVVLLKIAEGLGVGGGFILAEANLDRPRTRGAVRHVRGAPHTCLRASGPTVARP